MTEIEKAVDFNDTSLVVEMCRDFQINRNFGTLTEGSGKSIALLVAATYANSCRGIIFERFSLSIFKENFQHIRHLRYV